MSDSDSSISQDVMDQVTEIGTETIKSVVNPLSPTNIVKHLVGHITGKDITPEEEAKKKEKDIMTSQRIQEIEAEMARIRAEREKLTGPQIEEIQNTTNEDLQQQSQQPVSNIALKRAQTKVEGDKANKG